MAQLRVLLGFADASDHVVEEPADHVLVSLYGPEGAAIYPNPPIIQAALRPR